MADDQQILPVPAKSPVPAESRAQSPGRFAFSLDRCIRRVAASCLTGKGDEAARDNLMAEAGRYAGELAGPNPTAIEATLAHSAALAWLMLRDDEARVLNSGGNSFEQARYNLRRLELSHRRHLSVLKTLAAIRRVPLGMLQVNIGAEQVRNHLHAKPTSS